MSKYSIELFVMGGLSYFEYAVACHTLVAFVYIGLS